MKYFSILFILLSLNVCLFSQDRAKNEVISNTSVDWLIENSKYLNQNNIIDREEVERLAALNNWPLKYETSEGVTIELQRIVDNRPQYYETHNLNAAKTTAVDKVWLGGSAGLSLDGTGVSIAEWDGGVPLISHQEFGGRVTNMDGGNVGGHATHVAGTIMASGIDGNAKGMAHNASLDAYDWTNDESEMSSAAANGLLISNHSYGFIRGWIYNIFGDDKWVWFGNPAVSETTDYRFGFYSSSSVEVDLIANNAPYYLICKSAGNDRNDDGPVAGTEHWVYNGTDWVLSTVARNPDGQYDCISSKGVAKNILTIGAVDDISTGYTSPSDVVQSTFSSWGPADDGRIKPDIVGNGVALYSSYSSANNSYVSMSGTSMSSPNVTGVLTLLQQHYNNVLGSYMKSATLKALVIHTADEAGPDPGPDYMNGWGLINAERAAETISNDGIDNTIIQESVLADQQTFAMQFNHDGTKPIRVTMVWNDPVGTPGQAALNSRTPMLVNDLDVRITRLSDNQVFYPWKLDPNTPDAAAQQADNLVDNVEQVYIAQTDAGDYLLEVTHKGTLANGSQEFSIIFGGITNPSNFGNLLVTAPNGGEAIRKNTNYNINWASTDDIANINIEYTTDYTTRTTWQTIASNVDASLGSYTWAVPNVTSSNCKVRITDSSDPTITDSSDAVFTIRETGIVYEVEPNDTAHLANSITLGDTVHAAIGVDGDRDYYKFTATAGDTIAIYGEERNSSNLYGRIEFYNESGNRLNYNTYFTSSVNQRIVYEIQTTGTYYVRYSYRYNYGNFPNSEGENEDALYGENPRDRLSDDEDKQKEDDEVIRASTGDYLLTIEKFIPTAPYVESVYAWDINYNSAIFYGILNPNGLETTVEFEYGTSTSYSSSITYPNTINSYYRWGLISDQVTLQPNTTYHVRLKATNALGTSYSYDREFTTPAEPDGWVHQDSQLSESLWGVNISGLGRRTAVGNWETILTSIDDGNTWTLKNQNGSRLWDVSFANDLTGWAVGYVVLKTIDGGETWVEQTPPSLDRLFAVDFVNENTGWAVGANGYIIKTTDGGNSWVTQSSPIQYHIWNVDFVDENNGWAIAYSSGQIIHTTDGGLNWIEQNSGVVEDFRGINFVDANNGYVTGNNGLILQTSDGGANWNEQNSGTTNTLYAISFTDNNNGWAVGSGGVILQTFDGGTNWETKESGTYNTLLNIDANQQNGVAIVGYWGTILSGGTPEPPLISVQPTSFTFNIAEGDTLTDSLTISNTGNGTLRWNSKFDFGNNNNFIVGDLFGKNSTNERSDESSETQNTNIAVNEINNNETPDVLLIKDSDAWGSPANEDLMQANNIAYDLVNSGNLNQININKYKVCIVNGEESEQFYLNLMNNYTLINNFVNNGGVLEFHAGSNASETYNYILPLNVTAVRYISDFNEVLLPNHELVKNVPSPFTGTRASHNYFVNIPNDAEVVTKDESGNGNLIVYNYGSGTVIASGQTLEFGYGRGQAAGIILTNMIPYSLSISSGFLLLNPSDGTVAPSENQKPNLIVNGSNLEGGASGNQVSVDLKISHNDATQDTINIPITINVNADVTAPGTISDLSIAELQSTLIKLSWVSTGDNGENLIAEEYDMRYSLEPITEANFSSATRDTTISNPLTPGTIEEHTVSGLLRDTTYYFAIKTLDEVPLTSAISNIAVGRTLKRATHETEPNDSSSIANYIEVGDSINAAIGTDGDRDYYKFTATAGDTITIYGEERNSSNLSGRIEFYNEGGSRLYDNTYFTSSVNQRIVYEIPTTGTYYIRYSYRYNYGNFPNSEGENEDALYGENPRDRLSDDEVIRASTGDYLLTLEKFIPTAPYAEYVDAWDINYNSAIFYGILNPNGLETTVEFEYGTSTSYGSSYIYPNTVNSLYRWGLITEQVTLQPNTTYHVRLKATNALGTSYSGDYTFITPAEPEGWVHQNSGNNNISFRDVHFIDAGTGWAVGSYSDKVYKTTDGGTTWVDQSLGYSNYYYGVYFSDSNNGWVVGRYGRIYHTINGGTTWIEQTSNTSQYLQSISFSDQNNGIVVGYNRVIVTTSDGGTTWTESYLPNGDELFDVHHISATDAYLCGEYGMIAKTTDGGTTWIEQTSNTVQDLRSVSFSDQNNGIAVGYNRVIVTTSDGGTTWTESYLPNGYALFDVKQISATDAYLCGSSGMIAKTTDGGTTWTQENSGTTNRLYGLSVVGANNATVVGNWGTILTLGDGLFLSQPNGGEVVKIGSNYDVKWNSVGSTNINIEYTTDYTTRTTWQTIANNVDATLGSYTWAVPNVTSSNCKVRITDSSDPIITDESYGTFTIRETGIVYEVEPNDTAHLANVITLGDTVYATINIDSDRDYYKFTATAGDTIAIYGEERSSSNLNALIMLFDENGNNYANNDNYTSSVNQRIVYEIPTTGTYYIRYANWNNWGNFPNTEGENEDALYGENPRDRLRDDKDNSKEDDEVIRATTGDYLLTVNIFIPSAPLVIYQRWDDLNYNTVRLGGSLNPNGLETTVEFEYGTSTSYGSSYVYPNTFNSIYEIGLPTTEKVTLQPNTTYHMRMKATNALGTSYSYDREFTTPAEPEGWVHQDCGNDDIYFYDVHFVDASTGWAVGGWSDKVYKTTDGGITWVEQYLGYSNNWRVNFTDVNTGWVVGEQGKIYHTTDGGTTWIEQNSGTSNNFYDVQFINSNTGWVVGGTSTDKVYYTTDGGATWNEQNIGYADWWNAVYFVDINTGWIVGDYGKIYHTTDGGTSWVEQASNTGQHIMSISFSDQNNGIAVGYNRVILTTADGGITWVENYLPYGDEIYGVEHVNSTDAYLSGEYGMIAKTIDGGTTWQQQNSGTANILRRMSIVDASNIFIIGYKGTILTKGEGIFLSQPNGGEVVKIGSNYDVKWNSVGSTNINIEYTTDYTTRTTWQTIASNVDASLGSYTWAVPNVTSSNCKVRITDSSDPTITDESYGTFTIRETGIVYEVEPNDTAHLANAITIGDTVYAAIGVENDRDYYKFTATAGDTIAIYGEERNSSNLYGHIEFYNESGSRLSWNDGFTSSINQRIVYEIQTTGTYYIRYSYRGNWGSFPNSEGENEDTLYGENPLERLRKENEKKNDGDSIRAVTGDYLLTLNIFVPSAPLVSHIHISDINYNSTRFSGALYPNGLETTVEYEYGTTTSYGSSAGYATTFNGFNSIHLQYTEITLQPNTTYHIRMKATNSMGTSYSGDYTFTTPAEPDGWVHQESNTSNRLRDIDFIDVNNGWAVGYSNQILHTTDGGITWIYQESGFGEYYMCVDFINTNIGFVGGMNGVLLYTSDGGANWEQRNLPSNYEVMKIYFKDNNTGWAITNYGELFNTTNAGVNWSKQFEVTPDRRAFRGLDFSGIYGWIVGGHGKIWHTTDSGANWTEQTSGSTVNLLKGVDFITPSIGWAVGWDGEILFTSDGGSTWVKQTSNNTNIRLHDVGFVDSYSGWAIGDEGTIIHTTDGGTTWLNENSGTTNWLGGLSVIDANNAFTVGYWGTILHKGDGSSATSWEAEITVTDAGGARSSGTVTIGQAPTATDGLDAALGELELPPLPPSGTFEARLILPDGILASLKDYRSSDSLSATWQLTYQPGASGTPMTISWDIAQLPEGTLTLTDQLGGAIVNLDMKTVDSYSPPATLSTLLIKYKYEICKDISLSKGWNMVSVPVLGEDNRTTTLFPNIEGSSFYYFNGYQIADTLFPSEGYWVKNGIDETINVCGTIGQNRTYLRIGWNMIGTSIDSVNLNDMTTVPAGIISSQFFGFDSSYYSTNSLHSGEAYWIKSTENGWLNFNVASTNLAKTNKIEQIVSKEIETEWGKLTIEDASGRRKTLYLSETGVEIDNYSLPPVPPKGIFDVRFSKDSYVKDAESTENDLALNSLTYPVTISVVGIDVKVKDRVSGKIVNKVIRDGSSLQITNSNIKLLSIESIEIPINYELSQNYPNPFNPSTKIKFGLPESANVKLIVYNVLGEKVAELVNGKMEVGYHEISFNASNLSTGVYIYRLKTENFTSTKKMLLIK